MNEKLFVVKNMDEKLFVVKLRGLLGRFLVDGSKKAEIKEFISDLEYQKVFDFVEEEYDKLHSSWIDIHILKPMKEKGQLK